MTLKTLLLGGIKAFRFSWIITVSLQLACSSNRNTQTLNSIIMFKLCVFFGILAVAAAAPAPAPAPGPSPLFETYAALPAALPVASSSQQFVRNYNTYAAAPLTYAAPLSYNAYAYHPAPAYYI
ncbi:uncharacterized protein LOC103568982 [Microplitis demolitor]|uniref:uncharacterized protein LOC103568982 n=1 Tax=Microplitis demolitor TaxID=69319 RepID=UPI0004CCFFE0|nr:uncharacterized protein LOC103568982 [Microplitis demolitor]